MKERPENRTGQPPTRTPNETVDRLEEKKREDRGGANKERIEEQEQEIKGGR